MFACKIKRCKFVKVESFFPLLFLVSLLFVGCTNESEFDKQTKGSMVDLSVKLGMPQGAVQNSGVSGLSDPQIDNIRILVFSDGGVIDVNKKFKFDVCRDSYSLTARVGNHKRVVVVANAKGELDTKLSTILFYRDLKKLTLNPFTIPAGKDFDKVDFDKVLVGETSEEFALTSSGKAVGVTLVRAYAKILLYMYKSKDPKAIDAKIKINKIEFLNMASLSPLFPDYNTFWDNLTKGQLNTYSKDYINSKDPNEKPIELKCGDADPNNNLSILEYDTSKEKLTDRQIGR